MSKKNHTEIVCIIDRSGSMLRIKDSAIEGFNKFIEDQKKVKGTANVSLILFDDQYEVPFVSKDIKKVASLTDKTFVPRGMTALLDAIGRTVNETSARIYAMKEDERPEQVIMCILTDGAENSSRNFTGEQIKTLIDNQQGQCKWKFVFLAANQDAFQTASTFMSSQLISDSSRSCVCCFSATSKGTADAFADMECATSSFRNDEDEE